MLLLADIASSEDYSGEIKEFDTLIVNLLDHNQKDDDFVITQFLEFYKQHQTYTTLFICLLNYCVRDGIKKRNFISKLIQQIFSVFPQFIEDFMYYIFRFHYRELYTIIISFREDLIDDEQNPNLFVSDVFTIYPNESVEHLIIHDLLDDFKQFLLLNPSFDMNTYVENKYHVLQFEDISLLDIACYNGSINCFKYLIMNNCETWDGNCNYAVAGGNVEIIKIIEQRGFTFELCIYTSIAFHRDTLTDWLILNYPHDQLEDLPTIELMSYFNLKAYLFFYLINKDKEKAALTIIKSSISYGLLPLLKYILDKDENHFLINKIQPRDFEVKEHFHIYDYLLNKNFKLNISSIFESPYLFKYLIESGRINKNERDKNGKMFTHLLFKSYQYYHTNHKYLISLFKYLIEEQKIDINAQDNLGLTVLHLAIRLINVNSSFDLIKYICEKGADPNIQDSNGKTSLHFAYIHGTSQIVNYLITTQHARDDIKDSRGKTPSFYNRFIGRIE